ncbi:hypothetical protein FQN60_018150, partial [Etheostoma spectabile]
CCCCWCPCLLCPAAEACLQCDHRSGLLLEDFVRLLPLWTIRLNEKDW